MASAKPTTATAQPTPHASVDTCRLHASLTTTVTTDALKQSRIAILGYGSQGRAHALNLHESGLDVIVGVRAGGPSWAKAQADGLQVAEPADAVKDADLVAVLTPDMVQPALYNEAIAPNIKPNAALLFAHGFNVHFKQITPRGYWKAIVAIAAKNARMCWAVLSRGEAFRLPA